MKRALDDAGQVFGTVDAIDALAKGPVDFELIGVLVKIHFLVRMPSEIVRGYVSRDYYHRYGIEGGIGHAGGRVSQARTQVTQHHARFSRRARVAVGGMRCDLLVTARY